LFTSNLFKQFLNEAESYIVKLYHNGKPP